MSWMVSETLDCVSWRCFARYAKISGAALNSGVLLLPRAFVAFRATDFAPTMMAVGSLFMLKKQI